MRTKIEYVKEFLTRFTKKEVNSWTREQIYEKYNAAIKEDKLLYKKYPSAIKKLAYKMPENRDRIKCKVKELSLVFLKQDTLKNIHKRSPRLRKVNTGENSVYSYINKTKNFRETDNGKFGWRRVVDYYADYCLFMDETHNKIYMWDGNKRSILPVTKNGSFFYNGIKTKIQERPQLRVKICARHVEKLLNRKLKATNIQVKTEKNSNKNIYYIDRIYFYRNGEAYHILYEDLISPKATLNAFECAVSAFKERENKLICESLINLIKIGEIDTEVSVLDSTMSGNCLSGTNIFADSINSEYKTGDTILASELLKIREDNFTKRAVCKAFENLVA